MIPGYNGTDGAIRFRAAASFHFTHEHSMRIYLLATALLMVELRSADAADHRVQDVAGLRRAMGAAKPGDRILLAAGDYPGNHFFQNLHGSAAKPIVIAAANAARPPRLVGDSTCLQLSAVSHLELKDLTFTGAKDNALNIDDAGKPDKPSHHITLRNIRVTDVGPKGNSDGIKLSGVDDFLVVDCTVERWGSEGSAIDMVGCHRGVLTRCNFKSGGANAVQTKGGSAEIAIHRCLFDECGERAINAGGSTGEESFRPPLKAMPADGKYEAKAIRIEGCTFLGGESAIALVGVDGATVRFNTIVRPEKYALRILQENTGAGFVPCRDGIFEDNVVVFRSEKWGDGVNVGTNTAAETFKFSRNLWFCEDRPNNSAPKLPTPEKDGVLGEDPQFRDAVKKDFRVKPGSPAADRGAHALKDR